MKCGIWLGQGTRSRVGLRAPASLSRQKQRHQVRGHVPTSVGVVLDPKLPAQAEAVRIFDNIVERASREMMQNLV